MDQGLVTLIGMSIAYGASFLGMAFAYVGWKKRHRQEDGEDAGEGRPEGRRA